MKRVLLLATLIMACGDDAENPTPSSNSCSEIGGDSTFDAPESVGIDATYRANASQREISVRLLTPTDFVRADADYTISAVDKESGEAIPLSEVGVEEIQCQPSYVASGDLPDSIIIKMTHKNGFVREELVRVRAIEVTGAPETVKTDETFQLELSRDMPVIDEEDYFEGWFVELRGECVVDQSPDRSGYAFIRDPEGAGITQGTAVGGPLNVQIASESISGACEVELALVNTITGKATVAASDRNLGAWRAARVTLNVEYKP